MLEETRQIYVKNADAMIPEWREINKNDLIKKACEYKDGPYRDAYVSAIILNYWNKLCQYCYKCKLVAPPEEVHTWLTTSILYALHHQPWNNPESSVYQDVNGPDKVINRCMESRRVTFYQQLNRYNRKINGAIGSLDSLVDDYKDTFIPTYEDEYKFVYNEWVIESFEKKDYFLAFILDIILYEDVVTSYGLNRRKLSSYLKNLDEEFCNCFSKRYQIPLEKVQRSIKYITDLTDYSMKNKIEYNLVKLERLYKKEH